MVSWVEPGVGDPLPRGHVFGQHRELGQQRHRARLADPLDRGQQRKAPLEERQPLKRL